MAELLLIVSLLGIFAFGFYLMSRLDRFLEKNRKALLKENKFREFSEILLRSAIFGKHTEKSILSFLTEKRMRFSLR